ncbi:MAG: type II toxin-antitoxin system VapC family toxin [Chloroflexi bacterium]|nr:type II toxin-antitoxin system VapC family toxin [Chloroflexota bacterium]
MTTTLRHLVVDASAGIQLFVEEDHSRAVTEIFARIDGETPLALHVPDLFYIECASVLLKLARRIKRPAAEVQSDLVDLARLSLSVMSTSDLMAAAFKIAVQTGLTAYDACYLALAQVLKASLVTADNELLALTPFEGVHILTPEEYLKHIEG